MGGVGLGLRGQGKQGWLRLSSQRLWGAPAGLRADWNFCMSSGRLPIGGGLCWGAVAGTERQTKRKGQQALCSGVPRCHNMPLTHHGWRPEMRPPLGSCHLCLWLCLSGSLASWALSDVGLMSLSLDALPHMPSLCQ